MNKVQQANGRIGSVASVQAKKRTLYAIERITSVAELRGTVCAQDRTVHVYGYIGVGEDSNTGTDTDTIMMAFFYCQQYGYGCNCDCNFSFSEIRVRTRIVMAIF